MQNWEYKVVMMAFEVGHIENELDELVDIANALNAFGNQGWEVAGIYPMQGSGQAKVVLKKPVE